MKHNFEKGYTLAEMITVIAIIVIAAGIFANFGSSQKQLSLQRDVYSFAQNIRRVQQMASSISTVTNCDVNQAQKVPKNGYGIFVEKDTQDKTINRYILYANCACAELNAAGTGCLKKWDPPEKKEDDYYKTEESVMNSPIKLSSQVSIADIVAQKGADAPVSLSEVSILYQPPDPAVQIFDSLGNIYDSVKIEMKLKDTSLSRLIEINRAGLVNVVQQNQ